MNTYIAFLRAVNVGGKNKLPMKELCSQLQIAGLQHVGYYIQSGNLVFQCGIENRNAVNQLISNTIKEYFKLNIDIVVLSANELQAVCETEIFQKLSSNDTVKYYLSFIQNPVKQHIALPYFSKNKDVEIIFASNTWFISACREYKGIFGFPNALIEKLSHQPATTRNPLTVSKMREMAEGLIGELVD